VSYTLAFALQLRIKHGKNSARVAAHATQADTVQYKNIKSTIHRRIIVIQSSKMSQNNQKHRTLLTENNYG
jgi:hypothetical protein